MNHIFLKFTYFHLQLLDHLIGWEEEDQTVSFYLQLRAHSQWASKLAFALAFAIR